MTQQNILILPDKWGPLSDEQARAMSDEQHSIFPCGVCSLCDTRVFHNLLGRHRHVPAPQLVALVASIEQGV